MQCNKSSFNSVSLRALYNTRRLFDQVISDDTPPLKLSNVVYFYSIYFGNGYVSRKSQRFYVRRYQQLTIKLKRLTL